MARSHPARRQALQGLSLASEITATALWRERHPGALIGILEISGVANAPTRALEERKRAIESALRFSSAPASPIAKRSVPTTR